MLKRLAVNTVGSEARGRILARRAAALGTAEVDREPPRHADEPAAEALAVTQVGKSSVGPGERVLGDVLGVLPLPEDAERDAKRECRGIRQPCFELPPEVVGLGHQGAGQRLDELIHSRS